MNSRAIFLSERTKSGALSQQQAGFERQYMPLVANAMLGIPIIGRFGKPIKGLLV